ncbi:hypothetical protein ElyMa_004555100 [Elysia marginata]|uniref:Transmembrane protein n=1 Tax=Elysia marginata TaxID=1093978 RepID=A0AAV4HRV9_9GAST|nr:hypothetical protein ElyMa_004555100 [Elysia marginata]
MDFSRNDRSHGWVCIPSISSDILFRWLFSVVEVVVVVGVVVVVIVVVVVVVVVAAVVVAVAAAALTK